MIGAIIGDIAGSTYEFEGNKDSSVDLFPPESNYTDDTIMTVATAHAIVRGIGFQEAYLMYGHLYPTPMGGYGSGFRAWLRQENPIPYGSWGNGSAMRVSPIGWASRNLDEALRQAANSASVTHNHPEGIKGAQATVSAIWLARNGKTKREIREHIERNFEYNLSRSTDEVRLDYAFNESCQGTVPEAIIAFLASDDFEGAIRIAISLGGDADTVGCITGAIAHAFYREIPDYMRSKVDALVPAALKEVISEFSTKFPGIN
ncbi:MAG: ADP-ribosylglycohydrolase family protein [Nibricoccus sp.]